MVATRRISGRSPASPRSDPGKCSFRQRGRGLPSIDVSPTQGKWLHTSPRLVRARRILEIGTLGGYSTIWLA
ncbi:MAG: hypothetical protein WDN04_14020, partial [Rhodospirillales bacterium]